MLLRSFGTLTLPQLLSPLLIGLLWIAVFSKLREPVRQNLSAVMAAGAGAAYLSGGLGGWEFVFCALITYFAYRGLSDYRFIGAVWMLHSGWDVVHHLYGNPIVPFAQNSSAGCAICDPMIAIWYWFKAPSLFHRFRGQTKLAASGFRG